MGKAVQMKFKLEFPMFKGRSSNIALTKALLAQAAVARITQVGLALAIMGQSTQMDVIGMTNIKITIEAGAGIRQLNRLVTQN